MSKKTNTLDLPYNVDKFSKNRLIELSKEMGIRVNYRLTREDILREIRKRHSSILTELAQVKEQRLRRSIPSKNKKQWAVKRLMRDLREIRSAELDSICALPLKSDIFEWHVNILSPPRTKWFPGCFHVVLKFTEDYPLKPPKAEMMSHITHGHVYGTWICLDLLETHGSNESYHGWSSSYSVLSILLQIQSFLFEDEMKVGRATIKNDVKSSFTTKCHCGHDPSSKKFWPVWSYWGPIETRVDLVKMMLCGEEESSHSTTHPISSSGKMMRLGQGSDNNNLDKEMYLRFPSELWIHIFSFLDKPYLLRFSRINRDFQNLALHPFLWKSEELQCFHSKLTFRETTLGLGLNIKKNRENGKIMEVSTPLDLISHQSFFQEGIRKGCWKEPFEYFLPLYLDERHFKQKMFEDFVMKVYQKKEYDPVLGIDILCKLLSSMVVIIMKGKIHGSMKAIQGYAFFHRLLVHLIQQNPRLEEEMNFRIRKFIENEKCRHKIHVPSLGDFLTLVSVSSKYDWEDVKESFLQEVLDRNSLWIKFRFGKNDRGSPIRKVGNAFECVKISKCFTIFHISFLKIVKGRRRNNNNNNNILNTLARKYDSRYGIVEEEVKEKIQGVIFKVQKLDDYLKFYDILEESSIDRDGREEEIKMNQYERYDEYEKLSKLLDAAMERAENRGYFTKINTSGSFIKGFIPQPRRLKKKKKKEKVEKKEEEEEEEGEEGEVKTPPKNAWGVKSKINNSSKKKNDKNKKKKKGGPEKKKKKKVDLDEFIANYVFKEDKEVEQQKKKKKNTSKKKKKKKKNTEAQSAWGKGKQSVGKEGNSGNATSSRRRRNNNNKGGKRRRGNNDGNGRRKRGRW